MRLRLILLVPAVAAGLAVELPAQPSASPESVAEAPDAVNIEQVIRSLRSVSTDLGGAVARFQKHLNEAVARYDQGYRTSEGKRIPGADAEVATGLGDISYTAVRKAMIARMLAARRPGYEPLPAADLDYIQDLIARARQRLDASDALVRRLSIVSVKNLEPRSQAAWREQHDRLRSARAAAEDAAKKALVALPIEPPEGDSAQEKREQAWDLLVMGRPAPQAPRQDAPHAGRLAASPPGAKTLPLRFDPYRRVSLIHELGRLLALTNSGIEDSEGRHIFYQEEWIQRGMVVVRMRWRVGVDMKTGQHILLQRYRTRERGGELADLYASDRDYLWYLEPPEESAEPSRQQMEMAWARVVQARERIRAAARDYRDAIHNTLARNESPIDAGLPDELREKLFAIRGHLAGSAPVVEAEKKVSHAIDQAVETIRKLEPLAAWANRAAGGRNPPSALPASEWEALQERSDDEIATARAVIEEVRGILPPASHESLDKFPPLQKDVAVHLSSRRSPNPSGSEVNLVQEVWRLGPSGGGSRSVLRTATLISIDPNTGSQKLVAAQTKAYPIDPHETVDEIFDRYAGQDLPLGEPLP